MPPEDDSGQILFGIEYDTDFYPSVLLIPVSAEMANNVLSQIERGDMENGENSMDGYKKTPSPEF
jgi:hypothetical protein